MTTAGDMRDQIKSDLVINSTDYDTQILSAINAALRQYRSKRFWFLEDTATLVLLTGATSVALPTTYAAPGTFELSYNGLRQSDGYGFNFYDYDRLKRDYWLQDPVASGKPEACAVMNTTLYASHMANADYTIYATFYKKDAAVLTAVDGSFWFDDGYDAIRSLAMYIFKREAQGYTPTEEDGALARYYLNNLGIAHEARQGGR